MSPAFSLNLSKIQVINDSLPNRAMIHFLHLSSPYPWLFWLDLVLKKLAQAPLPLILQMLRVEYMDPHQEKG